MRSRERGGRGLQGERKSNNWSDAGSGMTERAEVLQDDVNIRSSW